MATFQKFQPFVEAAMEGKHNFASDTLKIALCAAANPPLVTNGELGDLTPILYTNLTTSGTGDRTLTVSSSAQTSGTYKLVLADMTLTATGTVAAWRYVVIYNDTATNKDLVGFVDRGSDIVLLDTQQLLLDFDGTNGLFTFV